MANLICAQLLFLEAENPDKDIHLYINSPGGSVTAGMSIYDTMQFIKPNVSTTCIGQACSMGAFLLTAADKVRGDDDFIFYNNLRSSDLSVEHTGDNRTGQGDGDDEAVTVDLAKVPTEVQKIAVAVTIHDGEVRRQSFGMVSNAFIRVVNQNGDTEIARYDLTEDASTETAMVFGEIYRHGAEWKFRAVGQGYASGLAGIAKDYGVNV